MVSDRFYTLVEWFYKTNPTRARFLEPERRFNDLGGWLGGLLGLNIFRHKTAKKRAATP
jgi:uncharacterized membrane protein YsdA (DUF1294 family)